MAKKQKKDVLSGQDIMTKIYGLYRMQYSQLKDRQSPSFFLSKEVDDYMAVGVFNIYDTEIGDEQYTSELAQGVKNKARFFRAEYNELAVPQKYVDMIIDKRLAGFYIELLTVAEAQQWLRDKTTLVEGPTGTFKVRDADPESGVEELYITVD